eukprot:6250209-Pyramimonas_sp.AAC.1
MRRVTIYGDFVSAPIGDYKTEGASFVVERMGPFAACPAPRQCRWGWLGCRICLACCQRPTLPACACGRGGSRRFR